METQLHASDHDNIVTLIEKVSNLTEEVRLMRDGTKDDIRDLQENKLDRREYQDFKNELDRDRKERSDAVDKKFSELAQTQSEQGKQVATNSRLIWMGLGAIAALNLLLKFL